MNTANERKLLHQLWMTLAKNYSQICLEIQSHLSEYDRTGKVDHLLIATAKTNLLGEDFAKISGTIAIVLKSLHSRTAFIEIDTAGIEDKLRNWILNNDDKFLEKSWPCYGKITDTSIYISKVGFHAFSHENNLSEKEALSQLEKLGVLMRFGENKASCSIRINNGTVSCYKFRRDGIF